METEKREKNRQAFRDMANGFVFLSLINEKISLSDDEYKNLALHYLESTGKTYDDTMVLEIAEFIKKESDRALKLASLNTMEALADFVRSGTAIKKGGRELLVLTDRIISAMQNRDTYNFTNIVPDLSDLFGVEHDDIMVFLPIGNSYKLSKVLQDFFKVLEIAESIRNGKLDLGDEEDESPQDNDILSQSMFNKLGSGGGTPPAQA
jgi:hypothetical protein